MQVCRYGQISNSTYLRGGRQRSLIQRIQRIASRWQFRSRFILRSRHGGTVEFLHIRFCHLMVVSIHLHRYSFRNFRTRISPLQGILISIRHRIFIIYQFTVWLIFLNNVEKDRMVTRVCVYLYLYMYTYVRVRIHVFKYEFD